MPALDVYELARRYVSKVPGAISGSGGHNQTFTVACALVKGFDLSVDEARPLMAEYNQRCDPPWTEAELDYKLKSADRTNAKDDRPRGWLRLEGAVPGQPPAPSRAPAPEAQPQFEESKLKTFAARWREWVDTAWLADRSPIEPYGLNSDGFLRALYHAERTDLLRDGEKVVVFTKDKTQGQALWPDEPLPKTGPLGVWFLAQPVDGHARENPRSLDDAGKPKMSRRSEESVAAWRYMVIESDEANPRDWLAALVQLPLRIAAIYTSGGKSIHALVQVDAPTKREWDFMMRTMKPILVTLGADKKSLTAVRLTRLPGCWREGKMIEETVDGKKVRKYVRFPAPVLQKLLYLNPSPAAEPICGLKRLRDTLGTPARAVESWLKLPASAALDAREDCDEMTAFLRWFESSAVARDLLGRLTAWREAAKGE